MEFVNSQNRNKKLAGNLQNCFTEVPGLALIMSLPLSFRIQQVHYTTLQVHYIFPTILVNLCAVLWRKWKLLSLLRKMN